MNAYSYRASAVYGNLAYDFTNPELFVELPQEEVRTAAPPRTRERERVVPKAKPCYAIAPLAIIGFGIAAVLLVFSLIGRVQLMQVSDETVALSARLAELEEEQSKLLIQYESTFNLNEIEDYAKKTLGMQKAHSGQIYFVGGTTPDKAVVLSQDRSGAWDKVLELVDKLGECFR